MKDKRKILAIVLLILPCLFFLIAYLLMSMSGEDVTQSNMMEGRTFPGILKFVYFYIPRIGEFITWPVSEVLTYQTSFGIDLLVRLIDVAAAVGVVYLLTFLALRRRLTIRLLDAALFDMIFLLVILVPQFVSPYFGNPFLSGFSFIHNYVTMSLIMLLFIIPFVTPLLGIETKNKVLNNSVVMLVLGFLFAISTELLPIAFVVTWILFMLYEKIILRQKINIKKWQIFAMIGIVLGFLFFYLGGGLSARTGFTYAETYDYISLSMLVSSPRYFILTFVRHLMRNVSYIIPVISFVTMAVVVYRLKKNKLSTKLISMFILIGVFSVIYITGSSLIMLDDAMAARFLLPCYLALIFGVGVFVKDYYAVICDSVKKVLIAGVILLVGSVVVIGDMWAGKIKYAIRTGEQLAQVREQLDKTGKICLEKDWASSEADAVYSPIFNFTQEPIFEPWNTKKLYGQEVVWIETGEKNTCNN